jgi:putative transposase
LASKSHRGGCGLIWSFALTTITDPPKRDRWARLRFSIIGPLLAAPPGPRELNGAFAALAAKTWRHPETGLDVRFGASTLERWYYRARRAADPVAALRDRPRANEGCFPSLSAVAIATLTAQYREHPGWTAQLHLDNLRAACKAGESDGSSPVASYATVRRYLRAQGMHRQARPKRATDGAVAARDRLEQLEVRSFEVEHVAALWHLDFHHASRKVLTRAGAWVKPMLLGVIDDRSRLVCHLQWYLDESAQSLVHGLSQAFMKRGLPRALMTDNGAAMLSEEVTTGLAALGVVHQTTLPYSPYQNAKQESFWGRVEGRLMAMLEGEQALTLDVLNEATQAWVEQEYHRTVHTELRVTPLAALPGRTRRWHARAPTRWCCATRCASRSSAAHAVPTARSAWVARASRSRRGCATSARCTFATPAGTSAASISSIPAPAPSCARSSRWTRLPTPTASAAG